MTDVPPGFDFRGVYCYPDGGDPASFIYVPGDPSPERDPARRPTLMLWATDQGAILQLGTQWTLDESTLLALREHIVERFAESHLQPLQVRLMPVQAAIEKVTLAIGDGAGRFEEIQSVGSSGFPPYTALFHVQITAQQKAYTVGALSGNSDYMEVTYLGSLPATVPTSTSITGDASTDVTHLGKGATAASAQAQLDAAIAAGRLRIQHAHPPGAPEDLRHAVETQAREMAAALLLKMARGIPPASSLDASAFAVTASRTETTSLLLERSTDVGTWFPDGRGTDHVRVLGVSLPGQEEHSAEADPLTVRLGFDLGDAPINFVELTWDGERGRLRGPDFEPVIVPVGEGSLLVKTYYTNGGPPYESRRVPAAGTEYSLTPADLGLAQVTFDGSGRRAAGAREIRLRALYRPAGSGTEDGCIVYLQEDEWEVSWYVVSRSADLDGVVEYEWQETAGDGSVARHPAQTAQKPVVRL
jgi:hypothetical protein